MKNNYIAPEASLICFRPVEDLAIRFEDMNNVANNNPGTAEEKISGDVFIGI